ncbi:RNA binding motif protein X-linked 2 [Rhodotorula toruloides]|uniref:RNA binding motif protein X-linked 2 n=1 Tax=Rhodotorula toruloides TaxID=5286 RepID=A0A511KQ13_RHOTO|nr:RNA binding motif protein X-linked 2 [Rhodotorula toruloides]
MNQIQAIRRINEQELQSGSTASWHDQYKDSAYINVGGLPFNLTEGDVITIFSQYGEVVDINMPRDPQTGKPRGFAWLMYADQRSTVLAVDNLNGAQVLGRTFRVDHVLNYKQLERDQESGKMKERDEQSLAAHPEKFLAKPSASDAEDSDSSHPSIDPDDPMRDYLISEKRKSKKRAGSEGESKEEKRRRKEERRRIREEREKRKEGRRAIEGGSASGRRREDDGRRVDDSRKREDDRERERDGHRRRDERDFDGRRRDERSSGRRRDDYDDRRRRDDRERDRRRRDERDERDDWRGGGKPSGGDAFADLEKWVRG